MLPVQVLVDIIDFLHLYELDALLLTNARCSELAQTVAVKIRAFDFSGYRLICFTYELCLINLTRNCSNVWRAGNRTLLEFNNETELVEFLPRALRNCAFEGMDLAREFNNCRMVDIVNAVKKAAHTIVISGTLFLESHVFPDVRDLADFVGSFHQVKSVSVAYVTDYDDAQRDGLFPLMARLGFGHPSLGQEGHCALFERAP
ncbi:hypothetical protein AAVH_02245 [Aphelenchoides avenae]|nr:hypothetical protein AAVH_02245 [Aphelenchus avenae]